MLATAAREESTLPHCRNSEAWPNPVVHPMRTIPTSEGDPCVHATASQIVPMVAHTAPPMQNAFQDDTFSSIVETGARLANAAKANSAAAATANEQR